MNRARQALLIGAVVLVGACVPALRLEPALAARPRHELRLRRGSDGDFSFGGFRVRGVSRGFWTSVSLGTTTTLGSGLSAGLSAFTSWQRIGLTLEGPDAGSRWACHCEKYRDEDDNFVGLACDVGRAEAPAYQIQVDGNAGWLTGADGTLEVSMQRALSGSMIGAHAYASGEPVAAVRLEPDKALVVASDVPRPTRVATAVLAAVLFATDDYEF